MTEIIRAYPGGPSLNLGTGEVIVPLPEGKNLIIGEGNKGRIESYVTASTGEGGIGDSTPSIAQQRKKYEAEIKAAQDKAYKENQARLNAEALAKQETSSTQNTIREQLSTNMRNWDKISPGKQEAIIKKTATSLERIKSGEITGFGVIGGYGAGGEKVDYTFGTGLNVGTSNIGSYFKSDVLGEQTPSQNLNADSFKDITYPGVTLYQELGNREKHTLAGDLWGGAKEVSSAGTAALSGYLAPINPFAYSGDVLTPTTKTSSQALDFSGIAKMSQNVWSPGVTAISDYLFTGTKPNKEDIFSLGTSMVSPVPVIGYIQTKSAVNTYFGNKRAEDIIGVQKAKTELIKTKLSPFNEKWGNVTGNVTEQEYNQFNSELGNITLDLSKQGITRKDTLNVTSNQTMFNFEFPEQKIDTRPLYFKFKEDKTLPSWAKDVALPALTLGQKTGEAVIAGLAFTELGATKLIGNVATATTNLAGEWGGAIGTGITKGLIYTGGATMILTPPIIRGMSAYQYSGGNIRTTAEGAIIGLGETSGFITGATNFDYLFVPGLKYRGVGLPDEFGSYPSKTLSVENPFGKGAYPLITKTPEGFNLGYPSKFTAETFGIKDVLPGDYSYQAGTKTETGFVNKAISSGESRLLTEQLVFEKSFDVVKDLKGVKIEKISSLQFEKGKAFGEFKPETQKNIISFFESEAKSQRGLKGFWNTIKGAGLQEIYGSSTISSEGGFKTNVMREKEMFGDVDVLYRGKAIPKAEELFSIIKATEGKNVKLTDALIEVKGKSGEFIHAFDIHGTDLPELQMSAVKLGFTQPSSKGFYLPSGKTIQGQQLRGSLIDKGGSVLSLRVNEGGKFYFSPAEHRIKDVSDFVSIADTLAGVKGGKSQEKIESLKNVLGVAFPEVKFGGGNNLLFKSPSPTNQLIFTAIPPAFGTSSFKSPSMGIKMPSMASDYSSKVSKTPSSLSSKYYLPSFSPSKSLGYSSPSFSLGSPSYSPPSPSPSPPSLSPSTYKFPSYGSPSPSPSPYPSPSPFKFGSIHPFIPPFPGAGWGEKLGRGFDIKRRFKYQPSIGAILKGLKSPKLGKAEKFAEFTGFLARPTITGKRKTPSSKKKKR